MSLAIVDSSGNAVGDYPIQEDCLEREKGKQAVQDTIVGFLAGRRSGSASTKNRAMVRGSEAKPWRQKGTGRARAGNARSPIWRGGGVVFGPSPRSYSKKVNANVRKLALKRTFTARLDEEAITIIDVFNLENPKTKFMVATLNAIGVGENVLIIDDGEDNKVVLSSRNLPKVTLVSAKTVNAYHLLLHKKIVLTKKALELLEQRLGKKK